ncbi:MAG TPA: ankyrin repeat domain-containing protein [Vicinamibacterales bacterium]|jgi:ankyrin repeat protein
MLQPDDLKRDAPLLWSAGTGSEVWALFGGCADGDLGTVSHLIDRNPALVRAHYEYRTPLYFAVRENRMPVARFLIERGAEPFWNGDDLVEMARIRGHREMEALIEGQRARFPRRHRRADPPLVAAASRGDLEAVRSLLEQGADPNAPEERNAPHGRALYSAVYNKHFAVTKLLLERGANPNQEVESSADAPSIAIMNSDSKTIELLASYGAIWTIPVQLADSWPA